MSDKITFKVPEGLQACTLLWMYKKKNQNTENPCLYLMDHLLILFFKPLIWQLFKKSVEADFQKCSV